MTEEVLKLLLQANQAIALCTVILLQIVKAFLPPDPTSPVGSGRFTVAPRFRKWLLLGAFVIAMALSVLLDPHKDQTLAGKFGDGLQTGAYSVVFWEIYSNWLRPILEGKSG